MSIQPSHNSFDDGATPNKTLGQTLMKILKFYLARSSMHHKLSIVIKQFLCEFAV